METITNTLRDSKAARWTALAVVAFTMLCGYYLTDVMAPLKPMLEKELLWNSADYGFFTSAYGWFNVFLLMLIFGGIILDKMGVRFTGKMATIIMVVGTAIKYWAISTHSLDGHTILGWKAQVMVAGLGFATFGVGVEVAGITVSKIIVKWFKGQRTRSGHGTGNGNRPFRYYSGYGYFNPNSYSTPWSIETNSCLSDYALHRHDRIFLLCHNG